MALIQSSFWNKPAGGGGPPPTPFLTQPNLSQALSTRPYYSDPTPYSTDPGDSTAHLYSYESLVLNLITSGSNTGSYLILLPETVGGARYPIYIYFMFTLLTDYTAWTAWQLANLQVQYNITLTDPTDPFYLKVVDYVRFNPFTSFDGSKYTQVLTGFELSETDYVRADAGNLLLTVNPIFPGMDGESAKYLLALTGFQERTAGGSCIVTPYPDIFTFTSFFKNSYTGIDFSSAKIRTDYMRWSFTDNTLDNGVYSLGWFYQPATDPLTDPLLWGNNDCNKINPTTDFDPYSAYFGGTASSTGQHNATFSPSGSIEPDWKLAENSWVPQKMSDNATVATSPETTYDIVFVTDNPTIGRDKDVYCILQFGNVS